MPNRFQIPVLVDDDRTVPDCNSAVRERRIPFREEIPTLEPRHVEVVTLAGTQGIVETRRHECADVSEVWWSIAVEVNLSWSSIPLIGFEVEVVVGVPRHELGTMMSQVPVSLASGFGDNVAMNFLANKLK